MPIIKRFTKRLLEAEVDGQELNPEQPTDYTEDPGGASSGEQPADDNAQTQPEEAPPQEGEVAQGEETTDYTDENQFPMDDGGGDDMGGDPEGDGAPPEGSSDEEQPVDELKQNEEELYSDLTPEQLDIKHKELKSNFLTMYDAIVGIIERLGDIATTEDNVPVVEYITSECTRIKDMITDYVNSVYQTKSHTENLINYNRFLAVLGGINKILEEMNKKED